MEEFVILEIRNLDKIRILVSTDPRTFNISDKTCYLDKFPNKAYLANYSIHHYFTLSMFYKIFIEDIEFQRDGKDTYYNIYIHPPLIFLSKRFQSDFSLRFKEYSKFNVNFLVKKITSENYVKYSELSISHYLSIVFKEQCTLKEIKPLQIYKYIEYAEKDKLRGLYSNAFENRIEKFLKGTFWSPFSLDFKNLIKKSIKPKEYIEIINMEASIKLIRISENNSEIINTSIQFHFKKYNKMDNLNTVVLHSNKREVDGNIVSDVFDLRDDNYNENEKIKLLIDIINENDGILYFTSSIPSVKETFIIYLFSNEKYLICTEDITNIPVVWKEVITNKYKNKIFGYKKVFYFFIFLFVINILLFLVFNRNSFK